MSKRRFASVAALAALAVITVSLMAWPAAAKEAQARPMTVAGTQPVNVNVSFSIQVPLADLTVEAIAEAQKSNRLILYRLAKGECEALKEFIAKTCRLNSLNLSTQVQNRHNQNPFMLRINVNARFTITLIEDKDG